VPIVNVPAGTQTCSIPAASVRTCPAVEPSDGTGVGAMVAVAAALGLPVGAALGGREAAGVAAAGGGFVGVSVVDAGPEQAATRMVVSSAAAVARRAFRGRFIARCYPRLALRRLEDPEIAR
jgi:hypothetical protein